MGDGWQRLTDAGSAVLREARLQVHYAAQLAAAPGKALAEPEPDFGHIALAWREGALAGPLVDPGVRAAIRPADLTLELTDGDGSQVGELPLLGHTLADGLAWLESRLGEQRGAPPGLAPVRRDIPHHPVADGAPFDGGAALAEIARLFANTAPLLDDLAVGSPVRCWPHHFDLARLVTYDPDRDPEEARSVGLGMTPGDEQYPDPYWYVTPWPYPDAGDLPDLPAGRWHTDGWVGAVLGSGEVVAASDQRAVVSGFLAAAHEATAEALGVD